MFQPRAQRRRDQDPGRRAAQLKPRLVLALPSGAFTGEQRAHHGATRSLNERKAVARAPGEQEDGQTGMVRDDLDLRPHREAVVERSWRFGTDQTVLL